MPDTVFYYLLLQQNGDLYLTYGYYDASEKDDPGSDDTSIRWVFSLDEDDSVKSTATKWFDNLHGDEMIWDGVREINLDAFPDVTFRWHAEKLEAVTDKETVPLYTGMPIWNVYFCDLTGDGKPELCSTISIGSGIIDNRIIVYDYAGGVCYELSDRMNYDYVLNMKNGKLIAEKRKFMQEELVSSGELVFQDGTIQIQPDETGQWISYTQNADGTYTAENGITYRYLLTLTGRSPNAVCDFWYTVLSNNENLTFERVNESLFTSNLERFFDKEEAVIVACGTF